MIKRTAVLLGCALLFVGIAAGQPNATAATSLTADEHLLLQQARSAWFTSTLPERERRIAWWREGRLGMLVTWGIYSPANGAWNGKKVQGAPEDLMRTARLTRKEYLQLAGRFTAPKFNADSWVRQAKAAGVRYMIFPAKGADGFAMYPSAVSDFNIVEQTDLNRDPLAELAAACRKEGMRFGFYYAHSEDWEDFNAPGNDWEYRNPGGAQALMGGEDWYRQHPELVSRTAKYVSEKVIPQLEELIRRYDPDMLWFDAPHKLPLSQNLRIMEAVRKMKHDIVINGHLVCTGEGCWGDYENVSGNTSTTAVGSGNWE